MSSPLNPQLSIDLVRDVRELLQFPFMVNALEAATIVAVLAAAIGWYAVLRRQSFTAHTLAVMAFPGASGAALAGIPGVLGYYLASGMAAGALARTGGAGVRRSGESATVGTVQAVGLALGFLFLALNQAILSDTEDLLFGTFLGVSTGQVLGLLAVAVVALFMLAGIGRPLLFATIDRDVAAAQGVPVRSLDLSFLALLALAVAATSQITGALLVFALLVAPPAAAAAVTARPAAGLALSIVLALLVAWLGLGIAYFSPYPAGFWITTFAFGAYLAARAFAWSRSR